jgi:hypothetical protein
VVAAAEAAGLAEAITGALQARGVASTGLALGDVGEGFEGPAEALRAAGADGPVDAVVVAPAGSPTSSAGARWEAILAEHDGISAALHADAAWARAVADLAGGDDRPVRLVTLLDATTSGGRSRAQAAAQLSRTAQSATDGRVAAFAVSVEVPPADEADRVAAVAAHLAASPDTVPLSGAELVVGAGWFGLRAHPRPTASITFGGPDVPSWLDVALREVVQG